MVLKKFNAQRLDEFKIIKKIFIAGKLVGYRFLIEEPNQV